ncbi:MAG: hypothetical protein A2Z20_13015 [Bdellovibrionales bacterium RBG_16_40_8]|nr:MAG: hypothetical protein A2Z20_13015 [Bdellovibrionales bacterium RBG_16_40_8]
MPDQSLSRSDKVLIFTSLIGSIIVGTILLRDDLLYRYIQVARKDELKVGEIISTKNDVRRRSRQSLSWYRASDKEDIYDNDSLFTGLDSEIKFNINNNQSISLGANSLVVIKPNKDEVVFDLQLGTMTTLTEPEKPIKIMYQGHVTKVIPKMNTTSIEIQKTDEGELTVSSATGEVDIQVQDKSKILQIKKNESASIKKDLKIDKKTFSIEFLLPKSNSEIWLSKEEKIIFKWRNEQPKIPIKLQISRSNKFDQINFEKNIEENENIYSWMPPKNKGHYFYRIVRFDNNDQISLNQKIDIFAKESVELISPIDKIILYGFENLRENELRNVGFQWEDKRGASKFNLEISNKTDFSNIIKSIALKSPHAELNLQRGNYYWRVGMQTPAAENFTSEAREFSVGKVLFEVVKPEIPIVEKPIAIKEPERPQIDSAATPNIIKAEKNIILKFKKDIDVRNPASIRKGILNPPTFSWEELTGANEYAVEIDKSEDFSSPRIIESLKETSFVWEDVKPGQYYWRVRGIGDNGKTSLASAPTKIEIKLPPPIITSPESDDQIVDKIAMLKQKKSFKLEWSEMPMTSAYTVIAEDKESITKKTEVDIEMLPNQVYEVKVAAVDIKGQRLSDYVTKNLKLNAKLMLKAPEASLPADKITVIAFGKVKNDPILFSWRKNPEVSDYELEFSGDIQFKNILLTKKVKTNSYILKSKLPSRLVYWRVRSRYGNNVSEWSIPRSYEVQGAI